MTTIGRCPPPLHSGAPQGPFPQTPHHGPLISDAGGPLILALSVVHEPIKPVTDLCDHWASPCLSELSLNRPLGPTLSLPRAGKPVGTKEALEKSNQNHPLSPEYVPFCLCGNSEEPLRLPLF